jgi:mercuric ion transport protein
MKEGRMIKASRYVYLAGVWLFIVGVIVQVFLAGMVVVAIRMGWDAHIGLGHTLAGPLLIMLISMYLGRLPRPLKNLTWLLFGVYVLQADVLIFLRFQAPVISALHPVLALFDFALGWALARRAWPLARMEVEPPSARPGLEPFMYK